MGLVRAGATVVHQEDNAANAGPHKEVNYAAWLQEQFDRPARMETGIAGTPRSVRILRSAYTHKL